MKLHFRKMGSGQPLIILHGIFGSSDNWQTLGRQFSTDFTVYLVDQRNHGHSPWSDEFGFPEMCDDLLELFEAEGITKAHIIGHSMGGKTAMHFAGRYPERIDKMVVADIGPQAYPPHHDQVIAALQSVDLNVHNTRKLVEDRMSQHIQDFGTKQFLLKNLYWNDQNQLAWRINIPVLIRELPAVIMAVPEQVIEIPVLFLRGGRSGYIRDEDIPFITHLFPNSEVATIADAGHWLHAEKPAEFYESVIKFLKE